MHDERGIIVSWLVKIVIVLAIVGVALYDASAIGVNHFRLDSRAQEMALSLSDDGSATQFQLEREAEAMVEGSGTRVVSIERDAEDEVIRVTLRRPAETLVLQRIDALKKWGRATATGRASTE